MADWRRSLTAALLGDSSQPPACPQLRSGVLSSDNPLSAFDWDVVQAILRDQAVRIPLCRMVRSGEVIDPKQYTEGARATSAAGSELVVASKVGRLLDAGASLILQDLQRYHEPVRVLARWLSWRLGVPIFVNAFATPAQSQGLAIHSDPYGGWLLQTHGSKHWQVWSPGQDPARDRADLVVTLSAGDALWIPRRWMHQGASTDQSSIHLTFALRPVEASSLVAALMESAAGGEQPSQSFDAVVERAASRISAALRGLSEADSAGRRALARSMRNRFLALPARWPPGCGSQPAAAVHLHRDGIVWRCEQPDGSLHLLTADDEFQLSPQAAAAFEQAWAADQSLDRTAVDRLFRGCEDAVALLFRSRLLCSMSAALECVLALDDR